MPIIKLSSSIKYVLIFEMMFIAFCKSFITIKVCPACLPTSIIYLIINRPITNTEKKNSDHSVRSSIEVEIINRAKTVVHKNINAKCISIIFISNKLYAYIANKIDNKNGSIKKAAYGIKVVFRKKTGKIILESDINNIDISIPDIINVIFFLFSESHAFIAQ